MEHRISAFLHFRLNAGIEKIIKPCWFWASYNVKDEAVQIRSWHAMRCNLLFSQVGKMQKGPGSVRQKHGVGGEVGAEQPDNRASLSSPYNCWAGKHVRSHVSNLELDPFLPAADHVGFHSWQLRTEIRSCRENRLTRAGQLKLSVSAQSAEDGCRINWPNLSRAMQVRLKLFGLWFFYFRSGSTNQYLYQVVSVADQSDFHRTTSHSEGSLDSLKRPQTLFRFDLSLITKTVKTGTWSVSVYRTQTKKYIFKVLIFIYMLLILSIKFETVSDTYINN